MSAATVSDDNDYDDADDGVVVAVLVIFVFVVVVGVAGCIAAAAVASAAEASPHHRPRGHRPRRPRRLCRGRCCTGGRGFRRWRRRRCPSRRRGRGRVRAVSFCILVRTSVVAEYAPSIFALS